MAISPTSGQWFTTSGFTETTTTVEMQYYEATGTTGNTPIYNQFQQKQTGTSTWIDATIQNPGPTAPNEKVNAGNVINSVTYTGLSFNTQYDFRFRYRDSTLPTNNVSGYSSVRTTTTLTPTDTNPPDNPTNLTTGTITENDIQLNWDGSNDAIYGTTGLKYYIEFRTYQVGSFVPNTNPSNFYLHTGNAYSAQTATVTGLSPFTQYEFRVFAQDPAGNDSGFTNIVSPTTADTTDPTAPTNLNASGTTSTTTNLSWTAATDNVGVTAYKIYQNGLSLLNIPASSTPAYTVTGLTANTNYSFYVSAFDAANNESILSNTISVLTNNLPAPTPTGSGTTDNLTYIKIPKLDANGNDNSTTLSQLTFLSIPSSNGDKATFNVIGISESSHFYTYTATPTSGSKIDNSATGSIQYGYTENLTSSIASTKLGFLSNTPVNLCSGTTTILNSNRATQRINQGINFGARMNTLQQKPIQITANIDITTTNTINDYYIGIFSASFSGNSRNGLGLITSSLAFQGNNNITLTTEAFIPVNQYVFAGWFRTTGGATTFSVLATGSMIISSSETTGNFNQSTFEPFLKFKFQNSDAEVLLNNANQYPTNKFLQDLDYSTSTTVAVNYPQILLGSASKGTVPRSYYTSLSSLIPKYIGAKNQSSDFNVYNPLAGRTDFGNPINIGTFGQLPSVDSKDNTIVEFDWAGATSPEIPFGGSFKLANLILEVSDISSVRSVNPGTNILNQTIYNYIWSGSDTTYNASASFTEERDDYYNVLNNSYPVGSQLVPIQYASTGTPILPKVAEIIETTIESPSTSIYGGSGSYERYDAFQDYQNYFIWQTDDNFLTIQKTISGNVGFDAYPRFTVFGTDYSTSTSEPVLNLQGGTNNFESSFLFEINNKLIQGERWFITLFNNFEFPVNVDNPNQVFRRITDGANPPLNSIGVFEIKGITFSGGGNPTVGTSVTSGGDGSGNIKIMFDPKTTNTSGFALFAGRKVPASTGNITNLGFLIWKSSKNYQEVSTIVNKNTSQVTAGGFMSTTTTDLNTNNFNSITRQFGNNTSN